MAFKTRTNDRVDVVDITDDVAAAVPADATGVCTVSVRHTTAGVIVNEPENRLLGDLERYVLDVVSEDTAYRHDEIDDNAAAHLRAILLGNSVSIPVQNGVLALGTWQAVLLVECDGPRTRHFDVTVTASLGE